MADKENEEEITEEIDISSEKNETQEKTNNKTSNDTIKDTNLKKKTPTLNKILFSIAAFLIFILILGFILFLSDFFVEKEKTTPVKVAKIEKIIEKENSFNIKDINSKKLNEQLSLLTNKNIVQEEEIIRREKEEEEEKIRKEEEKKKKESLLLEQKKLSLEKVSLENKRIELQKQKEELEELKNNAIALRDEMINTKKMMEEKEAQNIQKIKENTPIKEKIIKENIVVKEVPKNEDEDDFLSLINVAKIKGVLYKSYLDKISAIYSDLKLCRDDLNRIEIYYGPFEDNDKRSIIFKRLQENGIVNSYEVELTKEEFSKRCKY